jgi:hypothetical protein
LPRGNLGTGNPRTGIDETHPAYLGWCIEHNPNCDVEVATEDGLVVGCVFVNRRPDHAFLDDFCVADERWPDIGRALTETLIGAVRLICAPVADRAQHDWLQSSEFGWTSTFFSLRTPAPDPTHVAAEFVPLPNRLDDPPLHVFGSFDASTENGLRVSTTDGYAIGSVSAVPPAYDPGGPTTVIDRICGHNRPAVLVDALYAAANRGDVQVIVIVDHADHELTGIVKAAGATHPVNCWRGPSVPPQLR